MANKLRRPTVVGYEVTSLVAENILVYEGRLVVRTVAFEIASLIRADAFFTVL